MALLFFCGVVAANLGAHLRFRLLAEYGWSVRQMVDRGLWGLRGKGESGKLGGKGGADGLCEGCALNRSFTQL